MGSFYAVMKSDLSRPLDVRVDSAPSRAAAERLAREKNRRAVAEFGPAGPLYYCELVSPKRRIQRKAAS